MVNVAMVKPLYAAATALVLGASSLAAQQVLGRAVRNTDGTPLAEALIILLDDGGQERAERSPVHLAVSSSGHLGQAVTTFGYCGSANEGGRRHRLTLPWSRSRDPRSELPTGYSSSRS